MRKRKWGRGEVNEQTKNRRGDFFNKQKDHQSMDGSVLEFPWNCGEMIRGNARLDELDCRDSQSN